MTRPACLLVALLIAPPAAAQDASTPPPRLNDRALPTAFVLDDRGVEVRGKLLTIDRQSVTLLVDGAQRQFDLARVQRVSRRGDSLKNGALIGATVGVIMGILSAAISDCPGGGSCTTFRVLAVPTSIGIYTAIGTGVDAAFQGRTLIYERAPAALSPSGRAGVDASRRIAVSMRVGW